MQTETMVALVGIGGTLSGAGVQALVTGSAARRARYVAVQAKWGAVLGELFDAVSSVERWALAGGSTESPETVPELTAKLDHAFNRVILECPDELSVPATKYAGHAFALLRGEPGLEQLEGAQQDVYLVYRHIGGINKAIAWRHGGRRALKDIKPEYRSR